MSSRHRFRVLIVALATGVISVALIAYLSVPSLNWGSSSNLSRSTEPDVKVETGQERTNPDGNTAISVDKLSVSEAVELPIRSYSDILEVVKASSLEDLYLALSDVRYVKHWGHIASLIGFAGESEESSLALISYIEETTGWTSVARQERWYFFQDKAEAINWLGFTGGAAAEKKLLELIDPLHADTLLGNWSQNSDEIPWDGDRHDILAAVQSRAARGLLLMNRLEYDSIVEQRLHHISIEAARLVELSNENPNDAQLSSDASLYISLENGFYEGIIMQKYLKANGLEETKRIYWEPERRRQFLWSTALSNVGNEQ